jgi:site-specific recombinase XerD
MRPAAAPPFAPLRERFVGVLAGRNRSPHTLTAYAGDLRQFFAWLAEAHPDLTDVRQIERAHLHDYLTHLATGRRSGVTRARKLAALREFFKHLQTEGVLTTSPVAGVPSPKKERKQPTVLTRSEYSRLLVEAATHPRDFAILTLLLQTGIRVGELADLRLGDVDLGARTVTVRGKGQGERVIELERKGTAALKRALAARERTGDDHLFLNRYGVGLGVRGIRKRLVAYCRAGGSRRR